MKLLKRLYNSDIIFFSILCALNIILFINSFKYKFFLDDYFFLKIGRAESLGEVLHFFAPGKVYFYRPLTTEFFYFIIHALNTNTYLTHWIIWITYFTGIYFLYKILSKISGKRNFARLAIILYSIHFTHVFQLYHIATFIEVALFTFLTISFYGFIHNRFTLSLIAFVLALLSKETAVLFPIFLIAYLFLKSKKKFNYKQYVVVLPFLLLVIGAFFLFKSSVAQVAKDEVTYTPQLNPKLIINNTMWYSLWATGIPNYLPDYMESIFRPPINDFAKVMKNPIVKYQLYSALVYLITFVSSTLYLFWKSSKKDRIQLIFLFLIMYTGFLLFISPTLMIIHKWMVRLTIPVIFIVIFQSWVIYRLFIKNNKVISLLLVILFLNFNIVGIHVHENSSNFAIENRFVHRSEDYFRLTRDHILRYYDTIYIQDIKGGKIFWGESKKLEVTFHGEDFLDYYFPGSDIKVIYGFKEPTPPPNAFVIPSWILLQNL